MRSCLGLLPFTFLLASFFGAGTARAQVAVDWEGFAVKGFEMTAETQEELPNHLNCAYGPDIRQQLDLYFPRTRPLKAPVFVFIHGGGFERGDRRRYGWVARSFAKHGIITVVPNYRLTPKHIYPAQPEDIRRMLAWVYHNIASYGGDPARIYVGGHSAGGILSAFVGLKTDWLARLSLPPDLIKGIAPVSASYDLRVELNARPEQSISRAASLYVPDPAKRAEASPILNVVNVPPKSIVAVGSIEPYVDASRALVEKIRELGGEAELIILDDMNHAETALALADDSSSVFKAILHMIQAGAAPSSAR